MHYFDASFLIPLVRLEQSSESVQRYVEEIAEATFVTSYWTVVECRSALAREVRMGRMAVDAFHDHCRDLDDLISQGFKMIVPTQADYRTAATLIEAPESAWRSGDAMHVAVALRLDAEMFLTLDKRMAAAATAAGLRSGSGFAGVQA